jgi:hypothetical protein
MGSVIEMRRKKSSNLIPRGIKVGCKVVYPYDGYIYEVISIDDEGWVVLRWMNHTMCKEIDTIKNWQIIDQRQIDNARITREWGLKKMT